MAKLRRFSKTLKQQVSPDLIFTHNRKDAHQDHRLIAELTWNTFRNHLILEYEIPKYDGDLGQPSVFVPLEAELCQKKVQHIMDAFHVPASQALVSAGDVFLPDAVAGNGMQCRQRLRRGVLLPKAGDVNETSGRISSGVGCRKVMTICNNRRLGIKNLNEEATKPLVGRYSKSLMERVFHAGAILRPGEWVSCLKDTRPKTSR